MEEASPVKADSHRCHILDTEVDLHHALCLCAYIGWWEGGREGKGRKEDEGKEGWRDRYKQG